MGTIPYAVKRGPEPQEQSPSKPTATAYDDRPRSRGCCDTLAWHFREYRIVYMIISVVVMVAGVALLAAGIAMFVDPANRSTVSKQYDKFMSNNEQQETEVIRNTLITTTTHGAFSNVVESIPFRFVADAKDTKTESRVLSDSYWSMAVSRPSSTAALALTLNLEATWKGQTIKTEGLVLPEIAVVNGSRYLAEACLCIERTSELQYQLSANFVSCYFPFTADSHKYTDSATSTFRVSIRSGFDPYVMYLQRFGEGDLNNVRDAEVLTTTTPLALIGVGAAAIAIGLIVLLIFCCCVNSNNGRNT